LPPDLPPVPQALQLEATVRDAAGDEVAGRAAVVYHPARVYAGVRVEPSFLMPGDSAAVRLVAVRADTALAAPGTALAAELVRRQWRSVRKLLVGGRVGFETAAVDSVVESHAFVAGAEPVVWRTAPAEPGSYRIRVRAGAGADTSPAAVTSFYVAGGRAGAWRPEDAIRLELTTNRPSYAAGDTARLLITTPLHTTRAWLTVEREGVLESRLLELRDGAQVLEVPVREAFLPNVYVGLAAVEPALSKSAAPGLPEPARLPRFVMGYAPLRVRVDSRRLAVAVDPVREAYRPGERAEIDLEVRDAMGTGTRARIGVAVVDEAVLALLGSSVPDPFGFFYEERPLAVSSGDTRLRLSAGSRLEAARFKAEAGGDGAERLAARALFTTTAYWNPAVATDGRGHARVEFVLPDNLTRFRVVAVAAAGTDRFGSAAGGFRVAKPLTIEPALPRFAILGDTLELAAVVTNRGGAAARGTVRSMAGLQWLGKNERGVQLAPGASQRIAFRAVAAAAGSQPVRFEARLGSESDAVAVSLPVEAPRVPRTAATAARFTAATREEIAIPAAALPGSVHLEVGLAASALGGARPAYDYVVEYPYFCVEQLSSRLLVLLAARDLFAATPAEAARDTARITDTIARLEALSLPWQGFAFWSSGTQAPPWLEAYAAMALGRAQRAGWRVSQEVMQTAESACVRPWRMGPPSRSSWQRPGGPADDVTWWLELPAGMGFLALSERLQPSPNSALTPADVDQLADHAADLAPDQQLCLALALHRWSMHGPVVDRILQRTLERAEVTGAGAVIPAFDAANLPLPFRTTTRATSLALWLATEVRPGDPLVPRLATGLLAARAGGHWGTTQDDALALLALAAYRDAVEKTGDHVIASAQLAAAVAPLVSLDAPAGAAVRKTGSAALPLAGAPPGPAALDFTARGVAYSNAVLRWEEDGRTQPQRETGFTLARRVDRFEGEGPVRLGDLVVVTLTLVVPRPAWYLAIVDPLPAGLEIVQPEFATEARGVAARLARWQDERPALPVVHAERDDRELRLFTEEVAPGVYVHHYVARVRAAGAFAQPPARVEAMYTPELSGSTAATRWRALGPASEKQR
jgi:alpha-2-macroglobulin